MSEYIICEFCGTQVKKGDPHHLKKCEKFKKFIEDNKDKIYDLYFNKGYSMVDISNIFSITYVHAQIIFRRLGYPVRGVSESKYQPIAKQKYKETMLKNWGTEHNFNKNCESRLKWEKRLLEEEGITNVFQRDDVKKKIKKTMNDKYSEDEIYYNYMKGSTLDYWVEKLGEEEGKLKYEQICHNKGKSNRINHYIEMYGKEEGERIYKERLQKIALKSAKGCHTSINEKMNEILNKNGFIYKREFPIKRNDKKGYYCYDFLVNNELIIEMNGRFWHADPRWYNENDIMNFPGRKEIAKNIWKKDNDKKNLAIKNGYKFITIWEDDINNSDDYEILNLIQNEISKNKENNKITK